MYKSSVFIFTVLCFLIVGEINAQNLGCQSPDFMVVESMPQNVNLTTQYSTYDSWMSLIGSARKSIDIASFYWNMEEGRLYPNNNGWMGTNFLDALISANQNRGVQIRIVQNEPTQYFPDTDTQLLSQLGVASVRSIPWSKFFDGKGVLHTKFFIVDQTHIYLGSANMDWSSLAQVKEIGVVIKSCTTTALDLSQIFNIYWRASNLSTLPAHWPASLDTVFNVTNPFSVEFNQNFAPTSMFLASGPYQFCSDSRTNDIDSLLAVISTAQQTIQISVMDYSPTFLYNKPTSYWPIIDDQLRSAAIRGVNVQLMFSLWNHTIPTSFQYMRSLDALTNIEVKLFQIPELDPPIPFTRVNHAKYMVTDNRVYVGTSNWSADYFINTGGVSIAMKNSQIVQQFQDIFDRDWNSQYAFLLNTTNYH
jgi:phospholipase D3/4